MNTKTHEPKIIGIRELLRNSKAISLETKRGASFVVAKNNEPLFRIEPMNNQPKGKYTLEDLLSIRFHSKEKNLSKNIDKILYGI